MSRDAVRTASVRCVQKNSSSVNTAGRVLFQQFAVLSEPSELDTLFIRDCGLGLERVKVFMGGGGRVVFVGVRKFSYKYT